MSNIILKDNDFSEIKKLGLKTEVEEAYIDQAYQQQLWNHEATKATPPEAIKTREGFKKDGVTQTLEYVPEYYCLTELNRLYPGWWQEDMRRSNWEEVVKLETVVVEGYLCVSYPLPSGKIAVTKRWASADNPVKFLKDTKTPVDIGNHFKGARTEWLRSACKYYGIGLDIYHQKITPAHRAMFEDRIRAWDNYAGHWKKVISVVETGKTFRDVLRQMPSMEQVNRMVKLIQFFPAKDHEELWATFALKSNVSEDKTKEFDNFLTKLEQIAEQLKQKGE
jgi:hypothetical protein